MLSLEMMELDVQRDMDLVRELLLQIEEDRQLIGKEAVSLPVKHGDRKEVEYVFALLIRQGFVTGNMTLGVPMVSGLTWGGHDLLDNIRDPGVWEKVKEHAMTIASVSIPILAELAKAEVKRRLGLST